MAAAANPVNPPVAAAQKPLVSSPAMTPAPAAPKPLVLKPINLQKSLTGLKTAPAPAPAANELVNTSDVKAAFAKKMQT